MSPHRVLVLVVAAVLAWSGVGPYRVDVWLLEVAPVVLGGGAMVLCWRRFPWTAVTCLGVAVFSVVICVGGHHTYARVPFGFWLQDVFDLSRNPYDRIGHVLQGVVPALLARELLLRRTGLVPGAGLFWIVAAIALAISAAYELLEWFAALVTDPEAGVEFLAMQGDPWDTQWDMALALSGAVLVQLVAARVQDRQIRGLGPGA